ncbi:MAG: UDP-N-acetylmuramoyl-L-alanine--D-glutamate ligase [Fibrobacteria bacterium]|nr:UDP-N-acetylmuramoyl-L-alanine--D-glutamate ligase [Fibrobacteria bacterium]
MRFSESFLFTLRTLVPEPVEIVGGGLEGQSTARFLLSAGYERLTLRDRDESVKAPDGCDSRRGESYLDDLPERGTILRSAGVRPDLPAFLAAKARGVQVCSQLHVFLGMFQGVLGGRVVGITGTFGKGTVTTMLSEMLAANGIGHAVGGNIGTPMLDLLRGESLPDLVLLELSSFQLSDLGPMPGLPPEAFAPRIGVAGRVTIEHLDWHRDQIEYWEAKARLCEEQTDSDHAVFLSDDPGSVFVGMAGSSFHHGVGTEGQFQPRPDGLFDADGTLLVARSEMSVPGAFQIQNAALALQASLLLGADPGKSLGAARSFAGLPHRLQFAGEAGGVRFYNDSYATRPEATLAAVEALSDRPLALILGGSDKGIDFTELARGLRASSHLRHVGLIGATAGSLRNALESEGGTNFSLVDHTGLDDAFEACRAAVASGGSVLLSPACASFGLFRNYKERGEAFLAKVRGVCGG